MSHAATTPPTTWRRAGSAIGHSPLSLVGVAWLAILIVSSVFASHIAPHGPLDQNLDDVHAGPGLHYLLGTDGLGRDVLSRLMYGGSVMLLGAVVTTAVAVALGLPAGLAAGYLGGRVDAVVAWLADLSFALPAVVILIAVSVISPQNIVLLMVCLGVIAAGSVTRLIRNSALGVREAAYVDAAKVAGLAPSRIIIRHVLPSATAPLIVLATQIMSIAVVLITTLAYLGLGSSPEQPTWGGMIADASTNISIDPWLLVPTGGALILTILSLTFIGSTVRDSVAGVKPAADQRQVEAYRPGRKAVTRSEGEADALLEISELEVTFLRSGGTHAVVEGVSLSVPAGTTLGLVGETGCGKSVTALAVPGLLSGGGWTTGGSIRLDGEELTTMSERELDKIRGSRIGFVSQEPLAALDPSFTVRSQLAEAVRRHRGVGRATARSQVLATLGEVGIQDPERVASSFPHQISGGMAQRVAIALALAGRPELLIADEPTTALDVTVQADILDLLRDLVDSTGMAMLLVTHDFGVIADICDRVAVMYAGQIVEEGTVDDVLGHPGHPYTMALLRSMPELGSAGAELATIEGTVPLPEEWPIGCRFADRCPFAEDRCRSQPVRMGDHLAQRVRCIRTEEVAGLLGAGAGT